LQERSHAGLLSDRLNPPPGRSDRNTPSRGKFLGVNVGEFLITDYRFQVCDRGARISPGLGIEVVILTIRVGLGWIFAR
jgi:hypothetical protein